MEMEVAMEDKNPEKKIYRKNMILKIISKAIVPGQKFYVPAELTVGSGPGWVQFSLKERGGKKTAAEKTFIQDLVKELKNKEYLNSIGLNIYTNGKKEYFILLRVDAKTPDGFTKI
jgi:hypothetical protein